MLNSTNEPLITYILFHFDFLFADDAVEVEQGGTFQEGGLPSARPRAEYEEACSFLAAGGRDGVIKDKYYNLTLKLIIPRADW